MTNNKDFVINNKIFLKKKKSFSPKDIVDVPGLELYMIVYLSMYDALHVSLWNEKTLNLWRIDKNEEI